MSNDHGSNGPGEHATDTTTPPSAVADAIATVTATAGSVAFVRTTPTQACLAPRRSDPRARSLELDPACRIRGVHRPSRRAARLAICLTMVLDVGSATEVAATGDHPVVRACCPNAAVGASGLIDVAAERPGIAADEHDQAPDHVAHYTGGIAARLRRSDGAPVPGSLYLMMAIVGSDEHARLFEQTPFTHDHGPHADTMEANHLAVEAAAAITGNDIEQVEFTTAPGGGPSGGLIYLIAYLNLVSQGASPPA